jgi:CubicO group peptidase (beta-lactamase class C family)
MRSVSRLLVAVQAAFFLLASATSNAADNIISDENGEDLKPPAENAPISGTYQCRSNHRCDFSDFIESVCALVVVKNSAIVFGRFGSCRNEDGDVIRIGPETQFGLASIAKSITSTLIGLAHRSRVWAVRPE